jgi:hypothetical protein
LGAGLDNLSSFARAKATKEGIVPTAELIQPRSYNYLDRIWKQGVEVDITDEIAAELEDNPRFRLRGFGAARDAKVTSGKPKGHNELYAAIRGAADSLDPDNEAHYTVTGKPECQALAEILGYPVTATERDQATGVVRKAVVKEAGVKEPRFKIKKVRLTPPAPGPAVEAKERAAAPAPATDPTTLNAIEVN